ncbi:S-adenosyl-L-methionine-dependent methyltransferase [Fusarium oxysporum]|nr:S-adenosyl-L-methionine-dependent methyltransferase [Fusarium oxysporum]
MPPASFSKIAYRSIAASAASYTCSTSWHKKIPSSLPSETMPLESRPLGSSSEYHPELSQQNGSVTERTSTGNCTRSRSRTDHALSETSTIDSSDASDHRLKSEADHEGISQTDYDDAFTDRGDVDFDDEGYVDLDTASTTSVNTVAENFQQLFGRQYHNEDIGYHWEPNDETRQQMWDGFHHIYSDLLEGLNKATIPCGSPVLLLTSSGIWAIDFADEHPDADVIGIDISPIMPNWVPPNLKFQIDDCGREWTFKESSFDYIHARDLNGSVNWREFTKEVFRALAPGGVAEFHEGPIEFRSRKVTLAKESYMNRWGGFFRAAREKRRRPFLVANNETLQQEMAAAGFKDITAYEYEIPIGPWPESEEGKRLGKFALAILTWDIVGSILRLAIEDFGWSEKETHVFAARVRNEILSCSKEYEIYTPRKVVVGKKPE